MSMVFLFCIHKYVNYTDTISTKEGSFMPVLFFILGIIFLFEICIHKTGEGYTKEQKSINLLQCVLLLIAYFTKPYILTQSLGISIPAMIALLLGIKIFHQNWLSHILNTSLCIFVYLLGVLNNYLLVSTISLSFYFILLGIFSCIMLGYQDNIKTFPYLVVLLSFMVDMYVLQDIGGYVIIARTDLVCFAFILSYVLTLSKSMLGKKKERKVYEKNW